MDILSSSLVILEHGLKLWTQKEGKELYNDFTKAKKKFDEQMDRKSRTGKYSQLAVDRSLRDLARISDAYAKYISSDPTA